jgi:hypothetical protein
MCIYKINYSHGHIIVEKRTFHDGNYSKKKIDNSNLIVIVSNQSSYKNIVNIRGYIDKKLLFNDNFRVGNQHLVSYYYSNLSEGEHVLIIESEDGAELIENIHINNDKIWVYITYCNNENSGPKISCQKQNQPIYID